MSCCGFLFFLRHVFCVAKVASVSGMSFLIVLLRFSNVYRPVPRAPFYVYVALLENSIDLVIEITDILQPDVKQQ